MGLPSAPTYYWSMLLAGLAGLVRFLWDARAWRAELHGALLRSKWRAAGHRTVLLGCPGGVDSE
jgi:hypothetical protein